jgi:hypothetical protein
MVFSTGTNIHYRALYIKLGSIPSVLLTGPFRDGLKNKRVRTTSINNAINNLLISPRPAPPLFLLAEMTRASSGGVGSLIRTEGGPEPVIASYPL